MCLVGIALGWRGAERDRALDRWLDDWVDDPAPPPGCDEDLAEAWAGWSWRRRN